MNGYSLIVAAAACLVPVVQGLTAEPPASRPQAAAVIEPQARQVLRHAADYLAGLKTFRVTSRTTVSVAQEGRTSEFQQVDMLTLERPDKFLLRQESGPGVGLALTICDGRKLYRYRATYNRYSEQEATPQALGERKRRMAHGIMAGQTASVLLTDDLYAAFVRMYDKITHVGSETLDGTPCDRIRLVTSRPPRMSTDMWIRKGPQPLPVRVASSITGEGGPRRVRDMHMQHLEVLQYSSIDEALPAETFRFEPPAGAVKVADDELVPPPPPHRLAGREAPDMALELLAGGRMRLSEHRGRHVVILAFCNPEGPTCAYDLSDVMEMVQGLKHEDLRLYAVCPEKSRQAMRELLDRESLDIPVALDPKGQSARRYGVIDPLPMTVVIDRQGKVQVGHMGFIRGDDKQLRRQIRAALDGGDLSVEPVPHAVP